MRLKAFALQLKLFPNPGVYPQGDGEFPWSWTLENFVAWYFRIKSYSVALNLQGTVIEGGVPKAFSYVTTTVIENAAPNYFDERDVIEDTYQRAVDTDTAIPYSFWDSSTCYFEAFTAPTVYVPGGPIRGYWTGSQGGPAGLVIPRFNFQFSRTFDSLEFTPALTAPSFDFTARTRETFGVGLGFESNSFTFLGQSTGLYWNHDPAVVSFTTCEITVSAEEYFEFSDGVNPIWDSTTGAQLRDLLNP